MSPLSYHLKTKIPLNPRHGNDCWRILSVKVTSRLRGEYARDLRWQLSILQRRAPAGERIITECRMITMSAPGSQEASLRLHPLT